MSLNHATKPGVRYRYYSTRSDLLDGTPAWRVGAVEIERLVCSAIIAEIQQRIHARSREGDLDSAAINRLHKAGAAMNAVLDRAGGSEQRALILSLVRRIDVAAGNLAIDLKLDPLDDLLATHDNVRVHQLLPPALVRIGKQAKLLLPSSEAAAPADANLVKLLARAFAVRKVILESESIESAATKLGYGRDYAVALARVSYLAPNIVKAILGGTQPKKLSSTPLARSPNLPYQWDQQFAVLGFA